MLASPFAVTEKEGTVPTEAEKSKRHKVPAEKHPGMGASV